MSKELVASPTHQINKIFSTNDRTNKKKSSLKSQSKVIMRKSYGKRSKRKPKLILTSSEKKVTSSLKLKSLIPRALLPPPALSITWFATKDSLPSLTPLARESQLTPANSNSSSSVLQKSGRILEFHKRKSVSFMDFSHTRRAMNFPVPTPPPSRKDVSENNKILIPANCDESMTLYPKNSFVHRMYNQGYYLAMPGCDPQIAGMKIFATIMLNAWRKRRDEVRCLREEVCELKRSASKSKNQLHVFNRLFRAEQKRNDELNCQLKRSLEDINLTKTSCESLTTSLISLKADKALLEQQLQMKEQEYESTETLLTQTKSELFKTMTVQRELQAALSMEQRKIQMLENQKNELIHEICELNSDALQKEKDLRKKMQAKCDELCDIQKKLKEKEEQIKTLNEYREQQLSEYKKREEHMRQEMVAMEKELNIMRKCLQESIGSRFMNYWNNSVTYQRITLKTLHWLAYYVLPAMPPPTIKTLPFQLSLDKAVSIVKR